jgi:hypothetical protein
VYLLVCMAAALVLGLLALGLVFALTESHNSVLVHVVGSFLNVICVFLYAPVVEVRRALGVGCAHMDTCRCGALAV